MGDTTHDDDRPSLAAKDRGRRVPTRAELDELEPGAFRFGSFPGSPAGG